MVKIIDYQKKENKNGEEFCLLVLRGGLQIVKSETTSRCYATFKQATVSTTFYEATCKSLIGEEIPGSIAKVETEPYEHCRTMIKIKLRKAYIPVKTYAGKHKLTVQAVYKRIKTGRLKVKKIGTYTLVQDN